MAMGSRRASGGRDEDPTDTLASFAALSLLFACANTEAELHSALEEAATRLRQRAAVPVSVCEVAFTASGTPRFLWQSKKGGLSLDEDEAFAEWHARATRRRGALCAVRSGAWTGLLSDEATSSDAGIGVAVAFQGESPAPDMLAHARGAADAAAASSARIRAAAAARLERRRTEVLFDETQSWLELEADLLWEAGEDGVVHVRRIMNGRRDLAALLEGTRLVTIGVGEGRTLLEVLKDRRKVRHLRVEAGEGSLGRLPLLVSAHCKGEASEGLSCIGSFAATEEETSRHHVRETAAMMVQMRDARLREERQRREAEAMLQGLRLLLAQDSSSEKMAQLVSLVCECVGADAACVVQRGLDGSVRFLMPRQGRPGRQAEAALDLFVGRSRNGTALAFDAETSEGRLLADAFGLEGSHFATLPLPLRGDAAFLICAAHRREGFSVADLDFADRLTLLLRQALLLREEQSQLAQTAKMAALGQMSASIAHELRQPLNTISLAVQNLEILLEAPNVDSAAVAAKTKRVLAQVDRASEVIDRMRRFGRKSTGEQVRVPLRELAENVETIMHHVLLRAGVRLDVDVAEDLAVTGDPLQYEQVLGNLLQNAVDAISGIGAKHEREEGFVRLRAMPSSDEEGMIVLRVEDSGPGFRREILERVLEPFFTTKSAEHGTGLGLAICDTIIRESGGRIEIGNHEKGGYVALILPRDIA